jgi:hypothetical protein
MDMEDMDTHHHTSFGGNPGGFGNQARGCGPKGICIDIWNVAVGCLAELFHQGGPSHQRTDSRRWTGRC